MYNKRPTSFPFRISRRLLSATEHRPAKSRLNSVSNRMPAGIQKTLRWRKTTCLPKPPNSSRTRQKYEHSDANDTFSPETKSKIIMKRNDAPYFRAIAKRIVGMTINYFYIMTKPFLQIGSTFLSQVEACCLFDRNHVVILVQFCLK